jgi:hypothetical protein
MHLSASNAQSNRWRIARSKPGARGGNRFGAAGFSAARDLAAAIEGDHSPKRRGAVITNIIAFPGKPARRHREEIAETRFEGTSARFQLPQFKRTNWTIRTLIGLNGFVGV